MGREIESQLHDDVRQVAKDLHEVQTEFITEDSKIGKEWGCSADCLDYCVEQGPHYYFTRCENRCGWTCPSPFKFNGGDLEHIFITTPLDTIQK